MLNSKKTDKLADQPELQPYQMRFRWVMLALVWTLYSAFGMVSGVLSPLVTPVIKDLNLSFTQMGIIIGAWQLTYVLVAIFVGSLTDRWGIRKTLFLGVVIIGLSASLRYFADSFLTMFLCVALFGVGGPMISVGAPKTVSQWFRGRDRATAVGIYSTGSTTGTLIALSLTNSVIMPLTGFSWRLTFVVYGLLAFAAALMWLMAKDVKPTESNAKAGTLEVFLKLISIRNVKFILIMGLLTMVVNHGMNRWLPKILETGGMSPAMAGFAASIPTMVGLPLAVLLPRMVPPTSRGRIIALMAAIGTLPVVVVVAASGVPLIIGLVILGTINWAGMSLMMLILMDSPEIGSKYMGSVAGIYFSVSEIGGFIGPYLMGTSMDWTGSFMAGAIILAVMRACVAGMALRVKIKPKLEVKTSTAQGH